MNTPWRPNVTVAALIAREGRFLLVEEETDDGIRLNQPAGHLDEGESLAAACARETLEETAWHFTPTALVGIYQWRRPAGDSLAAGPPQGEAVKDCDPERSEGEQPSPPSVGRDREFGEHGSQPGERRSEAQAPGIGRSSTTYLRFAFCGELGAHEDLRLLDHGILRALWLTPAEIEAEQKRHRSPLVMQCVTDYLAGRRFPLELIRHYS